MIPLIADTGKYIASRFITFPAGFRTETIKIASLMIIPRRRRRVSPHNIYSVVMGITGDHIFDTTRPLQLPPGIPGDMHFTDGISPVIRKRIKAIYNRKDKPGG
jgi:hypothetical protein